MPDERARPSGCSLAHLRRDTTKSCGTWAREESGSTGLQHPWSSGGGTPRHLKGDGIAPLVEAHLLTVAMPVVCRDNLEAVRGRGKGGLRERLRGSQAA